MLYSAVIMGVVATLCGIVPSASVDITYVSHRDCNGVPHGTFIAHPGNCRQFVHCRGLRSILGKCPDGTYFNPTVYSCDTSRQPCEADKLKKLQLKQHKESVADQEQQTTTVATNTISNAPFEVFANTGKPNSSSQNVPNKILNVPVATRKPYKPLRNPSGSSALYGRPVCMYWMDQQLPHPQNCEYYYNCQRGYLTIRRCYNGLGWDVKRQRCVAMNEAYCYTRHVRSIRGLL